MRQNDFFANVLRACIDWPLHRQEAASISKTSDLKVLQKKNSFLQIASQKYPLFLYKLLCVVHKRVSGKKLKRMLNENHRKENFGT